MPDNRRVNGTPERLPEQGRHLMPGVLSRSHYSQPMYRLKFSPHRWLALWYSRILLADLLLFLITAISFYRLWRHLSYRFMSIFRIFGRSEGILLFNLLPICPHISVTGVVYPKSTDLYTRDGCRRHHCAYCTIVYC
jgi:hypothetical protein